MSVRLDHHIVLVRDPAASAAFYAEVLGLAPARRFGPFLVLDLANGVSLDFMAAADGKAVDGHHYAFLVDEEDFDRIFARIQERELPYYADPHGQEKGRINRWDGGRGVYWADPDGNWLEIITRRYGSGASSTAV